MSLECDEQLMMDLEGNAKICEGEDLISKLPDPMLCDILYLVSTEESVRTSVLSKRWRYLWLSVLGLDLSFKRYGTNHDNFLTFLEKFFDSHKESLIRKFRLSLKNFDEALYFPIQYIDNVTRCKIQCLDITNYHCYTMPLSVLFCETLVELRLCSVALPKAEFFYLPSVKIMVLRHVRYPDEATFEKLIIGSPVLEDLSVFNSPSELMSGGFLRARRNEDILVVRSQTVMRIHISSSPKFIIDAPLLQCLRVSIYITKKFKFFSSDFSGKLDIDGRYRSNITRDILTDIPRISDLVICGNMWKDIFHYSKPGPSLRFCYVTRLNAKYYISDLEMLPTILDCCPNLESLVLEMVEDSPKLYLRIYVEPVPKVKSSTVPRCLVSSLKFVELKRSVSKHQRGMELVRYFLENSTILEKLKLNMYCSEGAKRVLREELDAMPRCSSSCEVLL